MSYRIRQKGSVLALVLISIIILTVTGVALMTVSYGVRHQAIKTKNDVIAMLAAEAGYERAIFRMSQEIDLLTLLKKGEFVTSETIEVTKPDESQYDGDDSEQVGTVTYKISLDSFVGSRAVYRIQATGQCGEFSRTLDVYVMQAVSGWDMGMCRIPMGRTRTSPVYYVSGEVIDMPLHINSYGDYFDSYRDIHISGSPRFDEQITMSESRYSSGNSDKYSSVMHLFNDGILFLQPSSRIMDRDAVQNKVDAFKSTLQSQKPQYVFKPYNPEARRVSRAEHAVQLEFYVENGQGKVRITDDCVVKGGNAGTYDYKIDTGSASLRFDKYNIYGYHYIPANAVASGKRKTHKVKDTYVKPKYGDIEGEPGGYIYVEGNVVIGGNRSDHSGNQVVKGRITVVATGNIWIADSVLVDGEHDSSGVPKTDNPNILGLVAQGVIKVVDPGQSDRLGIDTKPGLEYEPIGLVTQVRGRRRGRRGRGGGAVRYDCKLPKYTTLEAAITVGGGGWGAEYVGRRKDNGSGNNYIVVRGGITEVVRGVVGSGSNGYKKRYYLDERVLQGILPGDLWLKGKYIPAPAGWHDYRSNI